MQLIFEETFGAGNLPQGWYTDTFYPKYSVGEWDCRDGDGVIIPLPHDSWSTLRVEVELSNIGDNATAFIGTDARTALSISLARTITARHSVSDGALLAQSKTPLPLLNDQTHLAFEWTAQTMRAISGESVLVEATNRRDCAKAGSLHTGFRGCVVKRIATFGEPLSTHRELPRAIQEGYPLEVTIDFNDDLMATAWTHQTFDALFKELKSWGTQAVSWIDLGREEDDYFRHAPYNTGVNGMQTFRNVGDMFTAAARHAHQQGIEIIGILKPYDMAIQGLSVPPNASQAGQGIQRVGGSTLWATKMAKENQHLLMARKPSAYGNAKNKVWTRLDLVKDDDGESAISTDDVTLLVSDDNETFREYSGPITRCEVVEEYPFYKSTPSGVKPTGATRRARVLRFENMEIHEPFFAIETQGDNRSFANRLHDLVHLFGENGEETHFTYGLLPRRADHTTILEANANTVSEPRVGPERGFEYNRYPGAPSEANTSGGDPITMPLALDRGSDSYLAFARGKDRSPLAAMSPSFPETRRLWLSWVEAMLDSGADGIDVRPGHHMAEFAWIEFGFEEPVREEMLRRTGIDIWECDDFDHNQWREVRGEGWTQFIREASQLVRSRGKKIIVHIDSHFDGVPGAGGAMNMECDWRTWITEGLCDGVTGKALWPNSTFACEVLELAHQHGVTVSYAPYCNNFFEDRSAMNHVGDSPAGCEIPVERLIDWGRRSGFDSFVFYECASALRANENASVNFRPHAEPLRAVLQRHFQLLKVQI